MKDYEEYRGIIFELISYVTVFFLWCVLVAVPISIVTGFSKLAYESKKQTDVLTLISYELKLLNENSKTAMQGAGLVPAE